MELMRVAMSQQRTRDNTGKWELGRHLLGYLGEWENGGITSSRSRLYGKTQKAKGKGYVL